MQRFIFGMVLILVAIFRPQGLLPAQNKKVKKEDLVESSIEEHKQTISI